jgi:hypothetical protein
MQVFFIVGGCTWSEIQSVHELSQQHGVEVVLGSTSLINGGEDFLRDMARLAPFGAASDSVAIEIGSSSRTQRAPGVGASHRKR